MTKALALISLGFILYAIFWSPLRDYSYALKGDPIGTAPRLEKEFKIKFHQNQEIDHAKLTQDFQNLMKEWELENSPFAIYSEIKARYFLEISEPRFLFTDVYLDDDNFSLLNKGGVYRIRYRLDNLDPSQSKLIRCEIQSKIYHDTPEDFVTGYESRLEFRNESQPFGEFNPVDTEKHCSFGALLETAQIGYFQNQPIYPLRSLVEELGTNLELLPQLTIFTSRLRFHINLKSPWGSGPNPDHTFIVTLDAFRNLKTRTGKWGFSQFWNMDGLPFIKTQTKSLAKKPSFYEVEIEFERNTSEKAKANPKAYQAFIKDLNYINEALVKKLSLLGYSVFNDKSSKLQVSLSEENFSAISN